MTKNAREFLFNLSANATDDDFKKAYGFAYHDEDFVKALGERFYNIEKTSGRDMFFDFVMYLIHREEENNVYCYAHEVIEMLANIQKMDFLIDLGIFQNSEG